MPASATAAPPLHPAHAANMAAKATRLARWIRDHVTVDADTVELFDDTDWTNVAGLTGERIPSAACRAMVPVFMRALDAAELVAARTAPAAPFKGVPA